MVTLAKDSPSVKVHELYPYQVSVLREVMELFAVESGQAKDPSEFFFDDARQGLEDMMNLGMGYALAAVKGNRVVGGCSLCIVDDTGFRRKKAQEFFLYVLPQFRNGTVGFRLIKGMEECARREGAHTLYLAHLSGDDKIGAGYRRLGYDPAENYFVKTFN